ncbi:hypothetical protein RQP46_011455 [Phenoliferia psychrophenolica]
MSELCVDAYTSFAQHQRIPENEQWTRTVKVPVIDTSFAYTIRAKVTVEGTSELKGKGAPPAKRESVFPGGLLTGLNEIQEGVILRVMMSQTRQEVEEVLESLTRLVSLLPGVNSVVGIGYDKCCEIETVARRALGPQCQSLMDRYHFFQRLLTTIQFVTKSSRYQDVAAALRAAIIKTPASDGRVAVCWPASVQLEKMLAVQERFRKDGNIWTTGPDSSDTVWESQLYHVRRGCLSPNAACESLRIDESCVDNWHKHVK